MATVATVDPKGAPQATIVWFDLEGEMVLVNTKLDRAKARNLARDPRVALAVFDDSNPYRSVQLRGLVREQRIGERAADDIHRLSRRYTGHDYGEPTNRISYLVEVESWSSWGLSEER
jgi:PPOX class probable F420-dependent enzyme